MKTKKLSIALAVLFATGALTFSSCKKKTEEPQPEEDTEQSTTNDNNLAENTDSDIESMGGQVSENGSTTTFKMSGGSAVTGEEGLAMAPCATVTGLGTQIITVDFGTSGCLGLDGRTRTGKLIYNFSASSPTTAVFYRHPGFSVNVTSQNYVVDGNQVNIISKTITNTTPINITPTTNLSWSIVANISITKAGNAGTVSWTCNRTKVLLNTNDPACYGGQNQAINWKLAKVELNGSATGTNAKGENFTAVATNLVRDFTCAPDPNRQHRHPFISGTIAYTPGSRAARLIDFGNGACDLNATMTVKGKTFNVTLP